MRRLYSTFAGGSPGLGLLIMRSALGSTLLFSASWTLRSDPSMGAIAMFGCQAVCGALIISGLGTPIVGTLVALIETWQIVTLSGDRWLALLLGSMGAALAMLGPGLWSADARLFGWRRIEIVPGKGRSGHP